MLGKQPPRVRPGSRHSDLYLVCLCCLVSYRHVICQPTDISGPSVCHNLLKYDFVTTRLLALDLFQSREGKYIPQNRIVQ